MNTETIEATEVKITRDTAETMYVESKETSYGIFCFNSKGDLFLNSDWGFYGAAWRAYGSDFKAFLKQCNAEYISDKFAFNYNMSVPKAKFTGRREQCVRKLIDLFLTELRKS